MLSEHERSGDLFRAAKLAVERRRLAETQQANLAPPDANCDWPCLVGIVEEVRRAPDAAVRAARLHKLCVVARYLIMRTERRMPDVHLCGRDDDLP